MSEDLAQGADRRRDGARDSLCLPRGAGPRGAGALVARIPRLPAARRRTVRRWRWWDPAAAARRAAARCCWEPIAAPGSLPARCATVTLAAEPRGAGDAAEPADHGTGWRSAPRVHAEVLDRRRRAGACCCSTCPRCPPPSVRRSRVSPGLLEELKPDRVVVVLPATLGARAAAQLLEALASAGSERACDHPRGRDRPDRRRRRGGLPPSIWRPNICWIAAAFVGAGRASTRRIWLTGCSARATRALDR